MLVYIDESGDLGWGEGGSRFLSVGLLFVPVVYKEEPGKIISSMYKKMGWKDEKKACDATPKQKEIFCQDVEKLIKSFPGIKIDIITVKKENVVSHIRSDSNKLYNYMISLVVPDYLKGFNSVILHPDERSIKVKSGNSLEDFLQIKFWFDLGSDCSISVKPLLSKYNYNIQFIDWVTHCAWLKYERNIASCHGELSKVANLRHLFF